MPTLARGALRGAGFGLAVLAVETWIGAIQIMQLNVAPPVAILVKGAGVGIALGAAIGALCATLLRLRRGRLWHLVAVALVFWGLELYAAPASRIFRLFSLIGPLAGVVIFLIAGRLATRRRWIPVTLGLVAVSAGVLAPSVRSRVTRPVVSPARPRPSAAAGAPDVVVVVLDTVRADHVSAYGYARPTTPSFDALARGGALFLDAVAPATWSLPSHASLFTGRFPSAHGAHDEHRFLDPGPPTLAEALATAGYETRSFTANAWISDTLGLTRGFAWTDEAWRFGDAGLAFHPMYRLLDRFGMGAADKGGGRVTDSFERWLATRPDDGPPAFTFLNFIEAHFPYHQLPASYLGRFTARSRSEVQRLSMQLFAAQLGGESIDATEAAPLAAAMYDAGILYADHLLGRVVEALRRRGTLDRTVVVVLADHGELLGEHGAFGHGFSLYEPVLHVPLLVRYPPRIAGGARVTRPVSTVGVYATILDLAGIAPPPSLQVGSLVPVIAGQTPRGPVLAEQYAAMLGSAGTTATADPLLRRERRYRAYRAGATKLVEAVPGGSLLFDLATDPAESHDRAGAEPAETARLGGELETWREALALPALDAVVSAGPVPEVDTAARARLRALGYVE